MSFIHITTINGKLYSNNTLTHKAIEYLDIRRIGYTATLQCIISKIGLRKEKQWNITLQIEI